MDLIHELGYLSYLNSYCSTYHWSLFITELCEFPLHFLFIIHLNYYLIFSFYTPALGYRGHIRLTALTLQVKLASLFANLNSIGMIYPVISVSLIIQQILLMDMIAASLTTVSSNPYHFQIYS